MTKKKPDSKEELQSQNEELSARVKELESKHADLENLIAVTDVAAICLNADFTVRWFTPAIQQVIHVKPSDTGRPLSILSHDFVESDLPVLAERVLKDLTPVEDEAHCHDGRTFMRRINPYRIGERRIEGVVMTFCDITNRTSNEEALRASEERYRTLFNSIDEGFCVIEVLFEGEKAVDYRFIEINPAFEMQTGIENAVGRLIRTIAPNLEDYWFQTFGGIALTGTPKRFQRRAEHFDRIYDVYAFRVGKPESRRVAVLFNDITERIEVETSLKQLNEQLEHRVAERSQENKLLAEAVSNLGEGVIITSDDLDWPGPHIVFVNEAICRITGYSAEELIGQTPRLLQGDGSDRETLDRIKNDLAANRSCLAELLNYRKDGTSYPAELYITPLFDNDGRRSNFVSIHRDITERKQAQRSLQRSEERTGAILNTAADAIITINTQGIITSVNPATEQMFGYTDNELVGQNVKLLMPSPYHDEHDDYISRYLETHQPKLIGIGREAVGRRKDSTTFPIDLAVSEIPEQGLFTGIIRDVTERRAAQERLIESERLAVLGEAMAGLAHESRNALSRSNANLNQLRRRLKGQEELLEFIERALHANEDIQRQFEEVREYAAPIQPRKEKIRLSSIVREAWEDLAGDDHDKHGKMSLAATNVPAVCEADPFLLRNVFRNLFENSIAACGDKSEVDVTISLSQVDSCPAFRISIRDNGPGLSPEEKQNAFNAFFTTKTRGTGLGLAIVRRIVEAHGGTVAFGQVDQPGAEVLITLPHNGTGKSSSVDS